MLDKPLADIIQIIIYITFGFVWIYRQDTIAINDDKKTTIKKRNKNRIYTFLSILYFCLAFVKIFFDDFKLINLTASQLSVNGS